MIVPDTCNRCCASHRFLCEWDPEVKIPVINITTLTDCELPEREGERGVGRKEGGGEKEGGEGRALVV